MALTMGVDQQDMYALRYRTSRKRTATDAEKTELKRKEAKLPVTTQTSGSILKKIEHGHKERRAHTKKYQIVESTSPTAKSPTTQDAVFSDTTNVTHTDSPPTHDTQS